MKMHKTNLSQAHFTHFATFHVAHRKISYIQELTVFLPECTGMLPYYILILGFQTRNKLIMYHEVYCTIYGTYTNRRCLHCEERRAFELSPPQLTSMVFHWKGAPLTEFSCAGFRDNL